MMKRIWKAAAVVLCLVLHVCACAPKNVEEYKTEAEKKLEMPSEADEKEYQKKLDAVEPSAYGNVSGLEPEAGSYFSIIGKGKDGEYWKQVEEGARQAVADLNEKMGYEGKDEVRVTYSGAAVTDSIDEQVNILDEELARYPVGLSISIADTKACKVQFDLAADNHIPIVAFDSGSDYQGLMATVSTDNRGSAQITADRMAEIMGESGEIIVFIQDSTSMSAKEREAGFTEKIEAEYPKMSVAGVYRMDQIEELKEEAAKEKGLEEAGEMAEEEVWDYILEKHPQAKGIYAADGTTVKAAVEALERAEREEVTVTGYDGDEEELEALREGKIDGLMIQNPFGMGYAAIVASARAALSMGNEAYVNTGTMWVTKENIDSDAVQAWLY